MLDEIRNVSFQAAANVTAKIFDDNAQIPDMKFFFIGDESVSDSVFDH